MTWPVHNDSNAVAVPNPTERGGQLCETQGHTFTDLQKNEITCLLF